jgi:hypothetical protein
VGSSIFECERLGETKKRTAVLVAGVENMILRFRHAAYARLVLADLITSRNEEAEIVWNGTRRSMPNYDRNGSYHKTLPELEPCGVDQNNGIQDGTTCFGGAKGDYISLAALLNASGHGPASLFDQTTGITLNLDVVYDNMADFWKWPFGLKMKYTYHPSPQSFSRYDEVYSYEEHYSDDLTQRTLVKKAGVLIQVNVKGHVGRRCFFQAAIAFIVSAGMFAVGDLIGQFALLQIYKRTHWSHVPKMYEFYAEDHTMDDAEFAKHVAGSRSAGSIVAKLQHHTLDMKEARLGTD